MLCHTPRSVVAPDTSDANLGTMRTLLAQRRPGHTLPQAFYTSETAFALDMQAIYARQWLQAGLAAEIPKPGDYLTRAFGTTSVLIVRDTDGSIKAHLNTCRHRGARLCAQEHGSARRIVCPYHQWAYDLSGNLLHARSMGEDFQRADHGLVRLRCETVAGFIFVALADDAPDFAAFRQSLETMLAPYPLRDAKIAASFTMVEAANWKLVMENARECYHCTARHPELMRVFHDPTKEDWLQNPPVWMDEFRTNCARIGIPTDAPAGDWYNMMRFPLGEGVQSLTLDGKIACTKPLVSDCPESIGTLRWALETNSFNHVLKDYAFTFEIWPVSARQTKVICHWLVHQDAVEGVDYDKDHLSQLWITTNTQDKWLAENNQLGVESMGYRPGPYSVHEAWVLNFVNWYGTQMQCALDAWGASEQAERQAGATVRDGLAVRYTAPHENSGVRKLV